MQRGIQVDFGFGRVFGNLDCKRGQRDMQKNIDRPVVFLLDFKHIQILAQANSPPGSHVQIVRPRQE